MVVNVVLNNDARTYKNEKGKLLKCPLCEKGFVVTNIQYNFRNKLDYKTSFYCKFCRENNPEYKKLLKKAREEGSFRSFGASNIFKTEEGQKLAKEGMIKKYGNYNPTLVSSLKEKQLKGKQRLLPSGKTTGSF